jgi:hypothetical protein
MVWPHLSREERRLRKWRKMIGAGGMEWKHYCKKKPLVVKRRIRKGIPDCLRGLVWQLVSGSRDLLLRNPGVYEVRLTTLTCGMIVGTPLSLPARVVKELAQSQPGPVFTVFFGSKWCILYLHPRVW